MNHELEIHNLAARGQLVQGPRAASIQLNDQVVPRPKPIEPFEADSLWEWLDNNNIDARAVLEYLDSFFKAMGASQPERRVYQRKCLPPDRPAYERKGEGLPAHDAKFLLAYNCGTCSFNSNDAVTAVDHVLRKCHPVSIVGSIQAVPVTALDIPEDVKDA
jgi:hypothetical protein